MSRRRKTQQHNSCVRPADCCRMLVVPATLLTRLNIIAVMDALPPLVSWPPLTDKTLSCCSLSALCRCVVDRRTTARLLGSRRKVEASTALSQNIATLIKSIKFLMFSFRRKRSCQYLWGSLFTKYQTLKSLSFRSHINPFSPHVVWFDTLTEDWGAYHTTAKFRLPKLPRSFGTPKMLPHFFALTSSMQASRAVGENLSWAMSTNDLVCRFKICRSAHLLHKSMWILVDNKQKLQIAVRNGPKSASAMKSVLNEMDYCDHEVGKNEAFKTAQSMRNFQPPQPPQRNCDSFTTKLHKCLA